MGLFVNRQKTCPICNRPTPQIFPIKIEVMSICEECGSKLDLPEGMAGQMTLEDFRQYLRFYDQNKALRDIFTETYRVDFNAFNSTIVLDTVNRLFRLKSSASSLVMKASELKSFRILEDNALLFEGEGDTLRCHSSRIPVLVRNMAPQITQFLMRLEMYQQLEHMDQERKDKERSREGNTRKSLDDAARPDFEAPVPLKHFYVELTLIHPYWGGFRGILDAPGFNRFNPSVDAYMRDYQERVDQLHTLAVGLMRLIDPNAREIREAVTTLEERSR